MKREYTLVLSSLLVVACGAAHSACATEARDFTAGATTSGSSASGGGGSGGSMIGCSTPIDCPTATNAKTTCEDGLCVLTCEDGWDDCVDGMDGCETAVDADAQSCGACGVVCALKCVAGECNDPVQVTTGFQSACALLKDGTVHCWGGNGWGELGEDNAAPAFEPRSVKLSGPAAGASAGGGTVEVGAGSYQSAFACALMKDGTVECWGDNGQKQLGLGPNGFNDPFPQPVVSLVNAVKVAVGGAHACAIKSGGDLFCWGLNFNGQVGSGNDSTIEPAPVMVLKEVADVALGLTHSCAIRTSGALYCWGNTYANMIGTAGGNNRAPNPVQMPPATVDEVSLGSQHTCARSGSEVSCWGADYQGQTGLSNFTTVPAPTIVTVPDVRSIDLGDVFTSAISGDGGDVWIWGYGWAGNGGQSNASPALNGLTGVDRISLGGGYGEDGFACALMKTRAILCWGADALGQLGDGPENTNKLKPVPVLWL
jgi:alpha-tubulin suppressor-like RCC1 family protein